MFFMNRTQGGTMKRIGPQMEQAARIVAANPGCNKLFVARQVGPHGSTNYGYRTVDRAIAHGLIAAELTAHGYRLTVTPEYAAELNRAEQDKVVRHV
jgi:hypothetical protein